MEEEGYEVTHSSGLQSEVEEMIRENKPDIIIGTILSEGVVGTNLFWELKKKKLLSEKNTIFMTLTRVSIREKLDETKCRVIDIPSTPRSLVREIKSLTKE